MARIWRPGITLDELRGHSQATMAAHLGIELIELGDDFLRGTMPVDQRTCQPMRILHGGASVALAETLGSLAAFSLVDPSLAVCLGQEINANHLRQIQEGASVEGIARPFHVGQRSHVWGIEIFDQQGRRTCVARLTVAVLARKPTAEAGIRGARA